MEGDEVRLETEWGVSIRGWQGKATQRNAPVHAHDLLGRLHLRFHGLDDLVKDVRVHVGGLDEGHRDADVGQLPPEADRGGLQRCG